MKTARVRSAGQYTAEREAGVRRPAEVPAPRLLHSETVDGWHLLVHECAPGPPADLAPGSTDLPQVLGVLRALGEHLQASTWPAAPHVARRKLTPMLEYAARFLSRAADTPTLRRCAAILDGWDPVRLPGETLAHGDIHPGNLHVTEHGIRLIDWGFACHAPAWFDAAAPVLRLIANGHAPEDAEALTMEIPAWKTAPEHDVTAYAALQTAFTAWAAARGPERLRARRAMTSAAGSVWLEARTRKWP